VSRLYDRLLAKGCQPFRLSELNRVLIDGWTKQAAGALATRTGTAVDSALVRQFEPVSQERLDHELAGSLGLKLHSGNRSSLCHSLQRLERFGLAGLKDPTVVIQTLLPPLPERLLRRAPASVHIAHQRLLAAAQHIERTKVVTIRR
jgi:hypothetical protein